MFLTKIELDPTRRLARKYLGSPQVMHAVVQKAAGDEHGEGTGRTLWRVDRTPAGTALFLMTPSLPDCSQLAEEAGAAGTEPRSLDYSPFLERIRRDQVWAFRLAANPSYSVPRGPGVRGKKVGHVTVEQQRQWFLDRASQNGFELVPTADEGDGTSEGLLMVVRRERPVFGRQRPNSTVRDRVTISRTVYEGVLRVTNPDELRYVLISGLGRSKAYGCGLMTLARPDRH